MGIGIAVFTIAGILYGWPRLASFLNARRTAAQLAAVKLIQHPVMIRSEHPADGTVEDRANELRTLVAMSGNTWISAADVHVRVWHPNINAGGTVRLTFPQWRQLVEAEYDTILAKYVKENGTVNDQIRAAMYGQNGQSN